MQRSLPSLTNPLCLCRHRRRVKLRRRTSIVPALSLNSCILSGPEIELACNHRHARRRPRSPLLIPCDLLLDRIVFLAGVMFVRMHVKHATWSLYFGFMLQFV